MSTSELVVGRIIAQWNPLGVPPFIAQDEYRNYIPTILACAYDFDSLVAAIEELLMQIMGLSYDPTNPKHRCDVERVSLEIMVALRHSDH